MKTFLFCLLLSTTSQTTGGQATKPTANALNFLKTYDGKFSYKVQLFKKRAFTQRLERLVGPKRYAFLKRNWHIDMPMVYKNDQFVAEACQRHSCGFTDFMVVYDFNTDEMFAGIRIDRVPKTYAEKKGKLPPVLTTWRVDKYIKK
ncbi:hypothetical protein [Spirosoma montaniterrae]|uniref:Uncharacterized protein n=1 Tax=Spirosoma montaniterrae TaxID=1178516 RepID=A0A1P9WXF7_9BACT|nr:hypothetical protein [Spirosoma montaniterrae]AQG79998.1 hypothetical protein AWR27_12065 [Spirosoma montaniterrae]